MNLLHFFSDARVKALEADLSRAKKEYARLEAAYQDRRKMSKMWLDYYSMLGRYHHKLCRKLGKANRRSARQHRRLKVVTDERDLLYDALAEACGQLHAWEYEASMNDPTRRYNEAAVMPVTYIKLAKQLKKT